MTPDHGGGLPAPLDGMRVLELAQAISGPFVGRILADLGADVVKVEWENGDVVNRFGPPTAGLTGLFTHMNAGKRGIGVDLKAPGAADLLHRLADAADVVVANFRPGVLDRAGLSYGALRATNPDLVMVSISGFGLTSPDSQRPAYAPVLHAESGLLARQQMLDKRPITDIAISLADQVAAMHATISVLAALRLRDATGAGQHVDLSMLEALLATDDHACDALDGTPPAETRGFVWEVVGGPILVSVDAKALWHLLTRHAGLVDPSPAGALLDSKIAARRDVIAAWLNGFDDRRRLIAELEAAGVAWADVRDASTVFESPSLRDGRAAVAVDDHAGGTRRVVRMPYRFSAATSTVRGPAPRRGEHNAEVLADWLGTSPAADGPLRAAPDL
ncbi:MAG: CoA transferase [Ilumatobacteraceae bacterium]